MSKVDQMPEYRANLPRTGHNLSHDFAFTASVAHLLPVFHDFLNPGETVTLGFDFRLRTQPLEAAAMSKLKTHTEYFFVPMQMLFQGFSDWYYGIHDQYSSNFLKSTSGGDFTFPNLALPKVSLSTLFSKIYNKRTSIGLGSGSYYAYAGEAVGRSAYRLFDMFGFRAQGICDGVVTDPSLGSIFPYQLLAYNSIYEHYYRLDTREVYNPIYSNVDRFFDTGVIDPDWFYQGCLTRLRPYDSDYFTDLKVSPIVDPLNLNNKSSLDAATDFLTRDGFVSSGSPGVSNILDSPFSRSNPSSYIQTQFGMKKFDSPISGQTTPNSDYTDVNGGSVINGSAIFGEGKLKSNHNDQYVNALHTHSFSNGAPANGLDIGTANIRAMFASEKLWSVTGRARKNYDDQTLSHFGFKVPHDPKHSITCFGHDVSEIAIGEVISTSNTSSASGGSPLGEIAGKGYGAQGNQRHKFTAPCHGVVMAIFSVMPEIYYEGTFAKFNKISDRSDLYTPEYDHLGMQPLFGYEFLQGANQGTIIAGWQYRYEQWKRRYNRCTTIFNSSPYAFQSGSLGSWFHTQLPFNQRIESDQPNDPFSFQSFVALPDSLNDLMLYQYQKQWSSTFETYPQAIYEGDPFVVASHIDCVKVSTMSDYSLPRLDS